MARARDDVLHEIKLMKGSDPIISTNVALRRDGLPSGNQKRVDDCGVAVYSADRSALSRACGCISAPSANRR